MNSDICLYLPITFKAVPVIGYNILKINIAYLLRNLKRLQMAKSYGN